jgi:hypothetical protein
MAPGYEVDQGVIAMNLSPGGNAEGNEPPTVTGPGDQTIRMGQPLQLTVKATDDGLPKSRGARGSGIRLRWEEYRGPGEATFDPPNATGQEFTTSAKFSAPGTYWLRATGFDGQLEGTHDVKVTVTPP